MKKSKEVETISMRLNIILKERFDVFCKKSRISVTHAINILIDETIKKNRIPFQINKLIENSLNDSENLLSSGNGRIGIEIETETKRRFRCICEESGYSMGMVIRVWMQRCIQTQKLI